jgi:site-specific recombinase XerC
MHLNRGAIATMREQTERLGIACDWSPVGKLQGAVRERGTGMMRKFMSLGLEPSAYCTHSMRRTNVAQIYNKIGNLRAVQLLLGHTKMDGAVRYLGVDIEDALTLFEGIDL